MKGTKRRLRAIILGIFDKRQHNRQYMRLIWCHLPCGFLLKDLKLPGHSDWAAERGYLYLVKYFAEKGINCSNDGTDNAAGNGHLHIVKYLYSKSIYCTYAGHYFASRNKHINVVKFLDEHCLLRINTNPKLAIP